MNKDKLAQLYLELLAAWGDGPIEEGEVKRILAEKLAEVENSVLNETGFICGAIEEVGQFIGGCGKEVKLLDSYRCADCSASFHRDCIRRHFGEERTEPGMTYEWVKEHDASKWL